MTISPVGRLKELGLPQERAVSHCSSSRQALSKRYTRFADNEAHGRSPLYEAFARNIATDPEILDFLLTLPPTKQQPNLLFAAVRFVNGTSEGFGDFKGGLFSKIDAIRSVMLERSTQTNEPARCATLLPILAQLPQPLALIEVGASAGLCLLPDFYGYDYGSHELHPEIEDGHHPVFSCRASAGTPLPTRMPEVVWRAGLDLNPLDAANPDRSSWLETLVWPEQKERLANLRRALRVAVAQKPRIVRGSLTDHSLALLCREAPSDVTLVVFHTAVLAYVSDQEDRRAFSDKIGPLCHAWICNESPRVMPDLSKGAGEPSQAGRFLLSLNREPVAWTDPHGAAIEWIRKTETDQ
ncbi:DUF2332 domain-containing protein [Methylobacterium sp. J-072]|uniref:DUF2332 domain-containing protein n=1 Tax=Methylobacterium sp. J-072 TaxID=2836651 RepID=UPI001FBB5D96|nr:DUF2332 domain-containing protein [Methylobacterium sp. J-072]MCJ2097086.1 DUF2332 domain-containing protein [Methylobacterium sp. J-072]